MESFDRISGVDQFSDGFIVSGFNTQIDISILICTIRTAYLSTEQIYEALSELPHHVKEKMIELIEKVIQKKLKNL